MCNKTVHNYVCFGHCTNNDILSVMLAVIHKLRTVKLCKLSANCTKMVVPSPVICTLYKTACAFRGWYKKRCTICEAYNFELCMYVTYVAYRYNTTEIVPSYLV